ncbi:MAG: SUMF1/EgtB/PvdO family nonheme iron enzyme [Chloroflexota bacterium]
MTESDQGRQPAVPSIQPDLPAQADHLDFSPYVQTFVDIITDRNTQTPLTIGVFGAWGSGKTSLMQMIRRQLVAWQRQQARSEANQERKLLTVWFNAWRYNRDAALWQALVLRVLTVLRAEMRGNQNALDLLDRIEVNLYRAANPASLGELVIEGQSLFGGGEAGAQFRLPTSVGLDLLEEIAQARAQVSDEQEKGVAAAQAFQRSMARLRTDLDRKRVEALESFLDDFQTLVQNHVYPGALVVFVDDLDRCLPEKAVEILEAIKLFFDVEHCIFVLGIDRQVIERGIRLKYHDYETLDEEGPPPISGTQYLEKIVQIPFQLPVIDRVAMEDYVREMVPDLKEVDARCYRVFTVGMEPNPRRVKRTLNIFLLLWRLARNHPELASGIKPVRLLKIVIVQMHHPKLFALLPNDPGLLIRLEERFRQAESQRERRYSEQVGESTGIVEAAGPEAIFLGNAQLRDLLTLHDISEPDANFVDIQPAEVKEYVHLSSSAVEDWAIREGKVATVEPQLVRVPAGEFSMGVKPEAISELIALYEEEGLGADRQWLLAQTPQHTLTLPAFDMGRYLVTNAEYAAFVESSAGAVSPPRHWKGGAVPPELARHPVVNVTWQDALAYCAWLSGRTGKQYRLPTEAEWEKAASWEPQGSKKRAYPWGDDWDPARCSNAASPERGVSPVGHYSQVGGDSAYGISDMAGNVWEWTLSKWGRDRSQPAFVYPYNPTDGRQALDGSELRVLRGGSFHDGRGWCRVSSRFPNEPLLAADYIGFRVVRVEEP